MKARINTYAGYDFPQLVGFDLKVIEINSTWVVVMFDCKRYFLGLNSEVTLIK